MRNATCPESRLHELLAEREIIYFQPDELLVMGSMHDAGGARNELPPYELLKSLADVARIADGLRRACGFPLQVVSAYRSETYNQAVGGVNNSQHRLGTALDLKPISSLRMDRLENVASALWEQKWWNGGLGIYDTFVHVDTGPRRRW